MKSRTCYEVVETRELPKNRPILADEIIRLTSPKGRTDCPELLRRIVVWDPENEREIVLLTNHLDFGATTISAIYKERWQIEIFFKTLAPVRKRSPGTCSAPVRPPPVRPPSRLGTITRPLPSRDSELRLEARERRCSVALDFGERFPGGAKIFGIFEALDETPE